MTGPAGMISFVLDGDAAAAVVDRLMMFAIAPSLGGVKSIVTQPVIKPTTAWIPTSAPPRGIADGMIRLSVGLEDPGDLIKDLDQALGQGT
jgi:cystathionine gamma-synthase